MHLTQSFRAMAFRRVLAISAAVTTFVLLTFALLSGQKRTYVETVIDRLNIAEADMLAAVEPDQLLQELETFLRHDPFRLRLIGLFDRNGQRVRGNIESLPPAVGETGHSTSLVRIDLLESEVRFVRTVARRLAEDQTLIVARSYVGDPRIFATYRHIGPRPDSCSGYRAYSRDSLEH